MKTNTRRCRVARVPRLDSWAFSIGGIRELDGEAVNSGTLIDMPLMLDGKDKTYIHFPGGFGCQAPHLVYIPPVE